MTDLDIKQLEDDLRKSGISEGNIRVFRLHLRKKNSPEVISKVYRNIASSIISGVNPIEFYRWLINYVINLSKADPLDSEFRNTYNYNHNTSAITQIVEKMAGLGVIINPGDRFGYIVCKSNERHLKYKAYETSYFLQSKDLEIDYAYYVNKLYNNECIEVNKLFPLPEKFNNLKYQRSKRSRTLSFPKEPLRLMSQMSESGDDMNSLLKSFNELTA